MTPARTPRAEAHLSWRQVATFRQRRQHLLERVPARALVSAVGDVGGIQSQLLSAAQLSVWARVRDLDLARVDAAIWEDRTLSKAWCMRRTLHLLPSDRLAVFVRGSARRAEREVAWVKTHGVGEQEVEELVAATLRVLDHPLTRPELADHLSSSLGLRVRAKRGDGWGSRRKVPGVEIGSLTLSAGYLLHLAGARGVVCSAPNRGSEATYVRADAWLPNWRDLPVEQAERLLLGTYLRAFAPATPSDYAWWTGMYQSDAQAIWASMETEMVPVEVEGWRAWALRRDLAELEETRAADGAVRLLPYFDSFLLGHKVKQHLVGEANWGRVFRPQGWVAPVVLRHGRAIGVWAHAQRGTRLRVRVEPFHHASGRTAGEIEEEARDLGRFLGCVSVDTEFG